MNKVVAALRRVGVFASAASVVRVVLFTAVLAIVASHLLPRPTPAARPIPADVPPSAVNYVGPVERSDERGFLPPPADPATFTVAWIGSSEVKLNGVSVPAAFAERVQRVGDKPLRVDAYTMLHQRAIDVVAAVRSAGRAHADAIVVSFNPVWMNVEWTAQFWRALDVADPGTLVEDASMLPWAASLLSPADMAWWSAAKVSPVVDQRFSLNASTAGVRTMLDVLHHPTGGGPTADTEAANPVAMSAEDFWLARRLGTHGSGADHARLASQLAGLGQSTATGDDLFATLLDAAADTGVPVYIYLSPLSFAVLGDPAVEAPLAAVEARVAAVAERRASGAVVVRPMSMSRLLTPADLFSDVIHFHDPGPFADLLVDELCATWQRIAGLGCTKGTGR